MKDALLNLPPRVKEFVEKSWTAGFSDIVFPVINKKRFAVLYSDNPASRPNTLVNAIIGALIIKELFGLTDEELLESILCDIRFQVALRTTSFQEQPFSDRTISRFRERLYHYECNTGEDLLKDEMIHLSEAFRKFLKIEPTLKRMDSLMVASGSKKMSRLEILYTCVANLVKQLDKEGETSLNQNLQAYLKEEHKNQVIYHQRHEDMNQRLSATIEDAKQLMNLISKKHQHTEAGSLLIRVMEEQTHTNNSGIITAKPKKEITPQSLQNPSVLRRKYHVDQMPVRGFLRSKMWFAFKVAAINVKRVLKKAMQGRLLTDFSRNTHSFWRKLSSLQQLDQLTA